jgi:hypothetical protein
MFEGTKKKKSIGGLDKHRDEKVVKSAKTSGRPTSMFLLTLLSCPLQWVPVLGPLIPLFPNPNPGDENQV